MCCKLRGLVYDPIGHTWHHTCIMRRAMRLAVHYAARDYFMASYRKSYEILQREHRFVPSAGWVGVQLPDWTTVRRRASPVDGYDLCYSARDMDLVTLFTARQGLLARMDYYWQPVELVRPLEVRGDGVVWQVSLSLVDKHEDDKVLVGATQCDPVMWVIN